MDHEECTDPQCICCHGSKALIPEGVSEQLWEWALKVSGEHNKEILNNIDLRDYRALIEANKRGELMSAEDVLREYGVLRKKPWN